MSGFLSINVIKEVKIRPGIYNREALIPPRKNRRQQLFMEVAESVTPAKEWKSYTEEEKEARMLEVSNKWKNLRDHFYREVKRVESGESNKTHKYIYYDDMEFVRPYIGYKLPPANKRKRTTFESFNTTEDSRADDTDNDMDDFLKIYDNAVEEENKTTVNKKKMLRRSKMSPVVKRTTKPRQHKDCSNLASRSPQEVPESFDVLNKIRSTRNPTFKIRESDISFCLSLVPTLRELGGARKLSAKIDVLKALHKHLDEIERNHDAAEDGDGDYLETEEMEEKLYNDPLNDRVNSKTRRK